MIEYIDRKSGEKVVETVMGDGSLRFAYETLLGRTLWPVLFGSRAVSSIMGAFYDSKFSRSSIRSLAAIPGCRADEAEKPMDEYSSFNEFFTRRLKAGARSIGDGIVSPADGRLIIYLNADANKPFPLKGATRTMNEVLQRDFPDDKVFDIAVIRLAPVDYHRFHFPCDCRSSGRVDVIPGKYHSVNPIALVKYPDVYADNERQIIECEADFGKFWLVDVGAFGVGTIVQTFTGSRHRKGDEKGFFKFGGSTVILITEAGKIAFAPDIVSNSAEGFETRVYCGEQIAVQCVHPAG